MSAGPVRLRVVRSIEADPPSTALLLAGPAAVELWQGSAIPGTVVADPPHRTPTAFVSRFRWTGPDLPDTTGVLTLTYVPGEDSPSTAAELVLDVAARPPGAGDAAVLGDDVLTALAEGFLANLARAACDRRAA